MFNKNNLLLLLIVSIIICIGIFTIYYYQKNNQEEKREDIIENFDYYKSVSDFNPKNVTANIPMNKLSEFTKKAFGHKDYNIGTTDKHTSTVYLFGARQSIKTFRLYPTEWEGWPSCRIALLTKDKHGNYIPIGKDKENPRTANSYHASDTGLTAEKSYLDSNRCWTPKTKTHNEMYLQLSFKNNQDVYGFIIKPRGYKQQGSYHWNQRVKKFVCFKSWKNTLYDMDYLNSDFITKVDNASIVITECLNCNVSTYKKNKDMEYDIKFKVLKKEDVIKDMSEYLGQSDYLSEYNECKIDLQDKDSEITRQKDLVKKYKIKLHKKNIDLKNKENEHYNIKKNFNRYKELYSIKNSTYNKDIVLRDTKISELKGLINTYQKNIEKLCRESESAGTPYCVIKRH